MNFFQNRILNISLLLCLSFVLSALIWREDFQDLIAVLAKGSLSYFGNFYLYLGFGSVVCILFIALSPFGKRRLGNEKPTYSRFSWIAMLYSTGMGSGLLLRAVQEPVYYYLHPPQSSGLASESYALKYTFFHWGFTPWAFYALFGLFIAYSLYFKEKSILTSSFLEGKFRKPWLITTVDSLTVISTLVGVIASLGLGSKQLIGGINYVNDSELGATFIILAVLFIGVCSTASAFLGVRNSIRRISNFNILLALAIMIFVLFNGDLKLISSNYINGLGQYLKDFIPMSLNIGEQKVDHAFLTDWTYFYWAFWLAWAPFTGVFIARISKGRTVREFALGTLIIPSLATFLWFSAFGTSSYEIIKGLNPYDGRFDSVYSSLFIFLEGLPLSSITVISSVILVFTFLVTSVDSAILVLSYYTQSDKQKSQRILWGSIIASVTVSLILIGQEHLLVAISNLLVLIGLPFSILFTIMIANFLIKLFREKKRI